MSYRPDNDQTIIMAKARRILSSKNAIIWSTIWLILALVPYLLFSLVLPASPRPPWFKIATYIFTGVSLFTTFLLCYRNWRHQRVLGVTWTWLLLGLAMLVYLIGEIFLLWWEIEWGARPDGSPADLAFAGFYLLILWALGLVLVQQHLTLNRQQSWLLVMVSAIATVVALTLVTGDIVPPVTHLPSHHWLAPIDRQLQPFTPMFNVFFILMELLLILMATILSIGFWSGRLGKTWQIVAQGIACLYVADLRFAYLTKTTGYASGDFMEIFWIAGILQLGIAAAVEWESAYGVKRLLR